jgi:hypothetical protein
MVKIIISLCALFIAAFLLYFIVCTNNEAELGQGYYYLSKAEAADVGYPDCESIIYKSDARNVFQTVLIKGDVVAISKNDKYILAVQAPLRYCNHNEPTIEDKSLLKYFIVDKEHDLLFGPYNEMDFLKKKGELAVPNTLVFRRGL